MMPSWKRLHTGRYVDLDNLCHTEVSMDDIEVPMNGLLRFSAHASPLTVAQHSVLVCDISRMFYPSKNVQLLAFTHDFAEAYTGDIPTPIKAKFTLEQRAWLTNIEDAVSLGIGLADNPPDQDLVKHCDHIALDIERRMMWGDARGVDAELWPDVVSEFQLWDEKKLYDNARSQDYWPLTEMLREMMNET